MRSRTGDAKQLVLEVTRQVAAVAVAQLADAGRIVAGVRRAQAQRRSGTRPGPTGRCMALVEALQTTIQRTRRLLDQARVRLAGGMPDGSSRLVSLHDPDARPIRKGRIGHPAWVRLQGPGCRQPRRDRLRPHRHARQPPDAPLLVPALKRVIARTGKPPGAVTADRGYGQASVEREVAELGVARIAIPRKAAPALPTRRSSGGGAFVGW
jgi:transposase, IS5 family